jgi:hypothetical protein
MKNENIYTYVVLLAFVLGIFFLPDKIKNKKNILKDAKLAARIKQLELTRRRVDNLRNNRTEQYRGPIFNFYPLDEDEKRVKDVCKSLFYISTLIESDTKIDIINNENYIYLSEYNKDTREETLKTILTLLEQYNSSFTTVKTLINLKICEYLYNKGCDKYSRSAMFNCVRNFRDTSDGSRDVDLL